MKNLFAAASYSFNNFYNNLNTQGQMIFSIIMLLISEEDEDTGVNFLEKYNLEPAEVDVSSNVKSNAEEKQVKAFKVSQVISPIYGVKKEVINDDGKKA